MKTLPYSTSQDHNILDDITREKVKAIIRAENPLPEQMALLQNVAKNESVRIDYRGKRPVYDLRCICCEFILTVDRAPVAAPYMGKCPICNTGGRTTEEGITRCYLVAATKNYISQIPEHVLFKQVCVDRGCFTPMSAQRRHLADQHVQGSVKCSSCFHSTTEMPELVRPKARTIQTLTKDHHIQMKLPDTKGWGIRK